MSFFYNVLIFILGVVFAGDALADCLEPLSLVRTGYDFAIYNSLLGGSSPPLFMVALPSHHPQFAIMLTEKIVYEETIDKNVDALDWYEPEITSHQWFLEYSEFNKRLRTGPKFDPRKMYDVDLVNDLKRVTLEIDKDLAQLISTAWMSVLRKTKYPSEEPRAVTLDGTSFIFKCDDINNPIQRYYGMTGSSDVDLVQLGLKLLSLVQSDDENRDSLERECRALAVRLGRDLSAEKMTGSGLNGVLPKP